MAASAQNVGIRAYGESTRDDPLVPNPKPHHPIPVTDPARRFCVQCGEKNHEHSRGDAARCHDCAGTPVPARFCPRTGVRLNPPAPEPRALLSSYAGRSYADGIASDMPGTGPMHVPLNEGLSSGYTRSR